jgi:hypothetical protein
LCAPAGFVGMALYAERTRLSAAAQLRR